MRKFFKITALVDAKLESCVIEADNARSAKKAVQQNFRECQDYESKVISVKSTTVDEFNDYVYGGS